jgi:hypothetical protein
MNTPQKVRCIALDAKNGLYQFNKEGEPRLFMTAKEWNNLQVGDKVTAYNGPYAQHGKVDQKWKDAKGMRWVRYSWITKGRENWGQKRYLSLDLGHKPPRYSLY